MNETKIAEELEELASKHGLLVFAEHGFAGMVYHLVPREDFYNAMLKEWQLSERMH